MVGHLGNMHRLRDIHAKGTRREDLPFVWADYRAWEDPKSTAVISTTSIRVSLTLL